MTKKLLATALTLMGAAFISNASAQYLTQTNAALGDLILGFETTGGGGSKDLLVDLGSVTNSAFLASVNLNLYSDLTNAFGSTFSNTVSYGLYAVTTSKTIYASGPTNMANGGYALEVGTAASTQKVAYQNMEGTFNNDGLVPQITTHGVWESTSESYAWSTFTPYNAAFSDNAYGNIDSTIGTSSSLYVMTNNTSSGYGVSDNLTATVSSAGVLTIASVPEPSSWCLFGFGGGGLLLMIFIRRRNKLPHIG